MAFKYCLLTVAALQAAVCYIPRQPNNLEGDAALASFLPSDSGLFVHPFGPQKQWNESYQELTFVSFPDSRGVLSSLGPLHDFAPLPQDGSADASAKFFVDFYEVVGHVVRTETTPDFPIVQVLFHARTVSGGVGRRDGVGSRLCIEMVAIKDDDITTSFCQVDEATGVCLANVTVPERWWSTLSLSSSTSPSSASPPREDIVELSFVAYTQSSRCPRGSLESNLSSLLYSSVVAGGRGDPTGARRRRFRPEGGFAPLPRVWLRGSDGEAGKYEVGARNSELLVLVPAEPIPPGRRFRVPVKLRSGSKLKKFSIRAKAKSGLRIVGIETHPPWQTELEVSSRRQAAEVKVVDTEGERADHHVSSAVFDWLLEVELRPSKVTFTMNFTNHLDHHHHEEEEEAAEAPDDDPDGRMNVRLKVAGGAVEKLIPVLENRDLINISPITGRPRSFDITVFAVSADQVVDVTERSACFSSDESVLQVSEMCGAYFTRGTETRGSTSVHIRVVHGGLEVRVPLNVWLLETPVQVELSDSKLSLMAGWKVPLFDPGSFRRDSSRTTGTSPRTPLSCQARFQSTTVDVYARLIAHDSHRTTSTTTATSSSSSATNDSSSDAILDLRSGSRGDRPSKAAQGQEKVGEGQVTYLLHRKAAFKVTHLLRDAIRSSDWSVVRVDVSRKDGAVVADGIKSGKSEIQVVSHTGEVVGSRDVRVSMDKVTLDHVRGHATSDLRLQVVPSNDFPGARMVKLQKIKTMTRRYQESPLEIVVGFDDDTSLPLRLIHPDDYILSVESLDVGVVEVVDPDSEFPRAVARGAGSGDLVSLALRPSRFCPTPRPRPLATGHVHVDVDVPPHDDLLTQNDAGHFFGFPSRDIIELDIEAVKKNGKFEKNRQKSVKFAKVEPVKSSADSKSGGKSDDDEAPGSPQQDVHLEPIPSQFLLSSSSSSSSSTVIHITMCVLLGVFGLAVAVFVVNCFFHVAKGGGGGGRKSKMMMANIFVGKSAATIKEVQDWIWIDKKTLERNAVNTRCTRALMSPDEFSRASKTSSGGSSSSSGGGGSGECRLSSATDFSSEVSCLSSSAAGGKGVGLYRGSECSVRIGGPALVPDDNGNTLPHDHHSLKCGGGGGVGGSYKQLHPSKGIREHSSLSEQIQVDSDVEMTESFRCAPGADAHPEKPKLQKKGISVPSDAAEAPNPILWKDEKLGMSYGQLVKYFGDLKESDA